MAGPTVSMHAAQNGRTIIDKEEILRITGGALDSHEALSGPIYLQGGEAGHVAFRNITITPAKWSGPRRPNFNWYHWYRFKPELQRIIETIETVAEDWIRL